MLVLEHRYYGPRRRQQLPCRLTSPLLLAFPPSSAPCPWMHLLASPRPTHPLLRLLLPQHLFLLFGVLLRRYTPIRNTGGSSLLPHQLSGGFKGATLLSPDSGPSTSIITGESRPVEDMTTPNLRFLSSHQVCPPPLPFLLFSRAFSGANSCDCLTADPLSSVLPGSGRPHVVHKLGEDSLAGPQRRRSPAAPPWQRTQEPLGGLWRQLPRQPGGLAQGWCDAGRFAARSSSQPDLFADCRGKRTNDCEVPGTPAAPGKGVGIRKSRE